MSKDDIHDLLIGAAVAVMCYAVWQHFKTKKQAATDSRLAAGVPQEIRQWEDPNSPVYGLPPELAMQLQSVLVDGLNMPIQIEGE